MEQVTLVVRASLSLRISYQDCRNGLQKEQNQVPIAYFNTFIKALTQAQPHHEEEVQVFIHGSHLHSEVADRMDLKALRVPV